MTISYSVKRTEQFLGTSLSFGEPKGNTLVRLSNDPDAIWRRPVHETWHTAGTIKQLKHPLIHHSGVTITQFVHKINMYTNSNAQYLFNNDVKAYWYEILSYPVGKFIYNYIYKQGFRDGSPGFIHALCMSFHSFLTRAKLYIMWKQNTAGV